jgi:hypothetical protein
MTRLVHAGTAALALAFLSLIAPSSAAARGECSFSIDFTASPGLTMTPSTGTYTSGGPTGTIICLGTIDGQQITGPGRLGFEGTYGEEDRGNTCAAGTGRGTLTIKVPTRDGVKRLSGHWRFEFLGAAATLTSRFFSGTFTFLPTAGDCLTAPVSSGMALGQGQLRDRAGGS